MKNWMYSEVSSRMIVIKNYYKGVFYCVILILNNMLEFQTK